MKLIAALATVVTMVATAMSMPGSATAAVDTIYVGSAPSDAGGSCADPDFSSHESSMDVALAAAIGAVDADDDVIVVCNGNYVYGASIAEIESEYDFGIVAEDSGRVTLDGDGRYGLISVSHPDTNLLIEGIRFVRAGDTGAIYRPFGDLIVLDSLFIGNTKEFGEGEEPDFGGGAINGNFACTDEVVIERSVFHSNSGPTGAVSTCTVRVSDSTFVNNRLTSGPRVGNGGALYVCFLDLTDSTFVGNEATYGGAVSACEIYTLEGNVFRRNRAEEGGAINTGGVGNATEWSGNRFVSNRARRGGAIFIGCTPANRGSLLAAIRRKNQLGINGGGGVSFSSGSCEGPG